MNRPSKGRAPYRIGKNATGWYLTVHNRYTHTPTVIDGLPSHAAALAIAHHLIAHWSPL